MRAAKLLPPRSIYLLDGEVRYDWEHSILPGHGTRFSVTFRGLSKKGLDRMASKPGPATDRPSSATLR